MTVELITAIVLGVLAWRIHDPAALLALSWTALTGIALSYIDAGVRRLPNRMVLIALTGSAASLTVGAVVSGHYAQLGTAVLCAMGTSAANLALALLPRGLGLGDVKLSFVTGMLAGWFGAGVAVMAFVLSLLLLWLAGIASLVMRREGPGDIAHGPLILLGLLIAVCIYG